MIPPLHLRRVEQTLRYTSKIMFHPEHNTYNALHILPSIHHNHIGPSEKRSGLTIASRKNKYSTEINYNSPDILPRHKLSVAPWLMEDKKLLFLFKHSKKLVSSEEVQQKFLALLDEFPQFHLVFTDGSKDGTRTANAVYHSNNQQVIKTRFTQNTSIFIAELHAVLKALELIEQDELKQVIICTDSLSVVKSLGGTVPSSSLHVDIFNLHHRLSNSGTQILFLWIPSHSGIPGNEKADKYAKEALSLNDITNITIEYNSIKCDIRTAIIHKWQIDWTNTTSTTQLRRVKPHIETWDSANRKIRQEEKVLARMRLGHTVYTHSHIYSQQDRPICTRCQHPETVKHIIIDCTKYQRRRAVMIEYCNREAIPFNLETILGDNHPTLIAYLFTFLREINIFSKL